VSRGLLSDEHFTVDGTLLEAWASLKSFRRKDDRPTPPPDDPGNPTVDFHGESRRNDTHQSPTDPDALLALPLLFFEQRQEDRRVFVSRRPPLNRADVHETGGSHFVNYHRGWDTVAAAVGGNASW
jgi:hypothetical protein